MEYPKGHRENLEFRLWLNEEALGSKELRAEVWKACRRDLLFHVNVFGWLYEPRVKSGSPVIPWVTWEYQDEGLLALQEAIRKGEPLCVEKSRDMGWTWKAMMVVGHFWLFEEMQSFLLASRTEDLVDARDDKDTLFWKAEFLIASLPEWMRPKYEHTHLHMQNLVNGSTIDGSSTNENLGRGGRRRAVVYDEFASVQQAENVQSASATLTDCPIYISTHKGVGTTFHKIAQSSMKKIRTHWVRHPLKSRGLYTSEGGRLVILDEKYEFPADYAFVLDGKQRSPWYDALGPVYGLTQWQIAGEIDINPEGSDYNLFDERDLKRLEEEYAKPPVTGELDVDLDKAAPLRWSQTPKGRMSLWGPLVMGTDPPADREYVVGVDIAGGTGASNSVIFVGDCLTGEQVFEFATNTTLPHTLARIAVAICQWFRCDDGRGAFLIWESSGPTGSVFGQEVIALGYRNVYYRQNEDDLSATISTKYGYATTGATKEKGLGNLMQGMISGRLKVRSKAIYTEWRGYTFKNGKVEYSGSRQTGNEADKGTSHGDRVIAAMVAWHRMRIRVGKDPLVAMERKIPVGSLAWRRQLVEAEHRESDGTEQW